MSTQLEHLDLAYIAGLFDGEGSVSYYQRKEKRKGKKKAYNYWMIRCELSMTDQYVVEWMHKTLGFGTFTKRLPTKSWVGKKTQWRWRCGYRDALQFAKMIWPYVQVKIHKIEQIIDHYDKSGDFLGKPIDLQKAPPSAKIIYLNERRKPNAL